MSRAVSPNSLCTFASAPAATRLSIAESRPLSAASCNGVHPYSFCESQSAPAPSNASMAAASPPWAA